MSVGKFKLGARNVGNRRRRREPGVKAWAEMSRRAHEQADRRLVGNRKLPRRGAKSIWAAIAMEEMPSEEVMRLGFLRQMMRGVLGLLLLPMAWVTTWTLLMIFSQANEREGLWYSAPFWYFVIGVLLMGGWFFSRLGQSCFLYLYVLGHELTHAIFVKFFGGKVYDIEWGSEGGYVTTDKTNWVIALSPYFVPFWSLVAVLVYGVVGLFQDFSEVGNCIFYGVIGASWAFHMFWTLWMIPRDQPDLTETGLMLSLVLIYFGNLLVLVGMLCFGSQKPWERFCEFGVSWLTTAATWSDRVLRWLGDVGSLVVERM